MPLRPSGSSVGADIVDDACQPDDGSLNTKLHDPSHLNSHGAALFCSPSQAPHASSSPIASFPNQRPWDRLVFFAVVAFVFEFTALQLFAICVLLPAYCVYVLVAMSMDVHRALPLLGYTLFVLIWNAGPVFKWCSNRIRLCFRALFSPGNQVRQTKMVSQFAMAFFWICCGIQLLWLLITDRSRLVPFAGQWVLILVCYGCSHHRQRIRWRPVIWGLVLQQLFGILMLRTKLGFQLFQSASDQFVQFINFADVGAMFVFGPRFKDFYFAFKVLPTITFVSSFLSLCFHFGWIQSFARRASRILRCTMGTSATESMCAAANIFVGQTEAPLLVRPFLPAMTMSELHAVMTGGFATVAGGTMAAYIGSGISPVHLLSASVMSCPASLAVSKLVYPEVDLEGVAGSTSLENDVRLDFPASSHANVLEAVAEGAITSISLVANIAVNVIAFMSAIACLDALTGHFGGFVNLPNLSLTQLLAYAFAPVALLIGADPTDCVAVGSLLAKKLTHRFDGKDPPPKKKTL